ncbi:MAG TPA: HAD family hydrolase [Patescibacteria group bacterium]|nr:HAD family hydrolase [Patescibacteria group bacterium]
MIKEARKELTVTETMQPRIRELQDQGITTICFDVDGTLIFGPQADKFVDARRAALIDLVAQEKQVDLETAVSLVQAQRELGKRGSDALGTLGISAELWYDKLCGIDTSELPQAIEANKILTTLKNAGIRLIAVTDEPLEQSERVLQASGIDPEIFDKRIGWQKGQPRPKDLGTSVFSDLAADLGCESEEMLMVGDRVEQDIKPALRAGYRVALVNNTPNSSSPSIEDYFTQSNEKLQAAYLATWENEIGQTGTSVFDIQRLPEYLASGSVESLRLGDSYIVTLDTKRLIERLLSKNQLILTPEIEEAIQAFNSSLIQILRETLTENLSPLVVISEGPFYEALDSMTQQATKFSPTQLVNIDRFIDSKGKIRNVAVISAGRYKGTGDESITERPGEIPLDDQMAALLTKLVRRRRPQRRNSITLIDDGFSTQDDFATYQEIFASRGIKLTGAILGIGPYGTTEWDAIGGAQANGCEDISVVIPVYNPSEWVCGRDFTIFGGKMWNKVTDEITGTSPYFAPFTDGSSASIPSDRLASFSLQLLQANLTLIQALEVSIGREVLFQDAITAGYGIPIITTNQFNENTPQPEDSISDYIQTMISILS